jgi:hypothetical protein
MEGLSLLPFCYGGLPNMVLSLTLLWSSIMEGFISIAYYGGVYLYCLFVMGDSLSWGSLFLLLPFVFLLWIGRVLLSRLSFDSLLFWVH